MFEKFTDRARRVMAYSNQEAQRLNHEYIGTEHIALGLVKEAASADNGGVAAHALARLGIDLRRIRLEVEKLVRAGPDMVTMGKLPQTPRAKKVIEYAIEEAKNFNHNYVGTEHLLLGLIRTTDGVASQVLLSLGATLENTRAAILAVLAEPPQRTEELPLEERLKAAIPPDARDRIRESLQNIEVRQAENEMYHLLLDQAIILTRTHKLSIVAAFAEVYERSRERR